MVIRAYQRFEGISDPDDTAIVYAIEVEGGARGTLVDAYGAYSDPMVGAFLQDVPICGGGHAADVATGRPSMFGAYDHGLRVPVPPDPWQDEGGESGAGQ